VGIELVALTQEPGNTARAWADEDERLLAVRSRVDRDSFALLYDRYVNRIYGYCFRRLQTRERAEDATSETFLKAVASIATYRPEAGSFRVWLFTIAHRVVIDAWRKARPELSLEGIGEIPEIGVSPEHLAIARDRSRDLAALVALLPVDQANVVQLRLAGLTDREIAVVLGRSHGAIRTAQHRAIKRLQELARAGDDTMRTRL
jgi:RNA polymerase sigma-70 factor (ECF subfamily)